MKILPILLGAAVVIGVGMVLIKGWNLREDPEAPASGEAGKVLTTYRDIPVRSNGDDYQVSHGKHYAADGYYYGQKWQCVEFVKRFYHDAFDHHMPDVWGHAKDFFDPQVPDGGVNPARGMLQFPNQGTVAPEPGDLLVFDFPPFGHVAVISAVRENEIEVVQQNVTGRPREIIPFEKRERYFIVGAKRKPVGWLRLPKKE